MTTISSLRRYAMKLPEVTEEPHHHLVSFRVRQRIFVTCPVDCEFIHVFLPEVDRERALALYPEFVEKLHWGGKVVGLRLVSHKAPAEVVEEMVRAAWRSIAPSALQSPGV